LALEQPVAKVDGKIDLVMLWDVEDVLFVLHVYGNELVANFRRMLGVVHEAELLGLDINFKHRVAFKSDAFTFNFLSPAVLVKTFSEKDHIGQYSLVVVLVDAVAHPVQIKRKNFIHEHFLSIFVGQVIVISLPFGWISGWRKRA